MNPISLLRFDALAGYARNPRARVYGDELDWFEYNDERVLGVLILDKTDGDYAGAVLARDERLQYRWTTMTTFTPSVRRAKALLRQLMVEAADQPDEAHHQGHQNPHISDFFTPIVPKERLSPSFVALVNEEGYSSALGIMEPMMRWYDDVDGNFVEQFQSTAFDARIWELYLYATFIEMGFEFDRSNVAPDFVAKSLKGAIAIEAVTVNPTKDKNGQPIAPPPIETEEQILVFLREYMPIKFGSPLYSKLLKEYWTQPHIDGMPFVIAIEDFSSSGSMIFTRTSLHLYLYGYDHVLQKTSDGKLETRPRKVDFHEWEGKKIESGFFFLPNAQNVSAVIFSNSGTISKFNRMGMIAGFGSSQVEMVRQGTRTNLEPGAVAPVLFEFDVHDPDYKETWVEGLDVYHNPTASIPLDPDLLPGAAHHFLEEDGSTSSFCPDWHPLGSLTRISVRNTDR